MNQRTLLTIAAALTAFVLMGAAVVATRLAQPADTAQAVPAAQTPALAPSEAAYQQRLADYEAALAEANRRLELANQQLAEQAKVAADAASAGAATAATFAVSAERAQSIALEAAPGATLTKPAELVRYQGTPAYEVVLDRGTVYVDAQSATVLANGAMAGEMTAEQAAQLATAYRGGGEVREVELEREHGATVYAVVFADGGEVYVDAASGQVVYAQLGRNREGDHGQED
jgi:uncharacterized membrane protein YkoI